jgi:hypothetical protein
MEETIGKRINVERTEEALATGAATIAVGCPFCSTMLTDGTRSRGAEDVEVTDVASVCCALCGHLYCHEKIFLIDALLTALPLVLFVLLTFGTAYFVAAEFALVTVDRSEIERRLPGGRARRARPSARRCVS